MNNWLDSMIGNEVIEVSSWNGGEFYKSFEVSELLS